MDSITLIPPSCFAHDEPLNIMREFFDLLSEFTYDGEGEVAWHMYLQDLFSCLTRQMNALMISIRGVVIPPLC